MIDIMRYAEYLIRENRFIRDAEEELNEQYLKDFSIGNDVLEGEIGVAKQAELRHILEKLELWLHPKEGVISERPAGSESIMCCSWLPNYCSWVETRKMLYHYYS